MEEQEVRNFLRGEGEELTEVAIPIIDIGQRCLQDIADEIESEGLDHLIKNLGTIANTFKTENDYSCPTEVIEEGVKLIHTALQRLYNGVSTLQGNVKTSLANIDRPTKLKFRKYMAVLFFLINKSFVEIERAVAADSHNISVMAHNQMGGAKGKRGKKPSVRNVDENKYEFWEIWRSRVVSQLLKVMSPPMDEIWEGNLDGFNFMRCITLALCSTVKSKTKYLRGLDEEGEEVFDILGILASRHQEEKAILSRLIPMVKESEEAAGIVADGISRMVGHAPESRQPNMVLGALSEALDTYMNRLVEKDTAAEKGYHKFLIQMAVHHPKGIKHSLAVLIQFLELESVPVRTAVLIAAHEVLNYTWDQIQAEQAAEPTEEDLSDERPNINNWREFRKKVLNETILRHNQDVAAVVRSKSMQLLSDLVENRKLLTDEYVDIMHNARLRLLDKNNFPRKHAAGLVIDIVKNHPHMVRPTEEYYRKRQAKVDEIVKQIQEDCKDDPAKALFFIIKEFHWHRKTPGFVCSNEIFKKISAATDKDAVELLEESLKARRYWESCEILHLGCRKWSDVQLALENLKRNDNVATIEDMYMRFFKNLYPDVFPGRYEDLELQEVSYIAPKRIYDARDFLEYIQSVLLMKKELEECHPSLRKLLELGTTVDKKEAVMFFAAICEGGYKPPHGVIVSIINALSQLTEDELKDFVDPFKSIFIGKDNYGSHGVVKKLIELVEQLPEKEVESLGSIIGQLYSANTITNESVKILWDAFSQTTGGWDDNASCSAGLLIGIIGQIKRQIITSNLSQLIEGGLGPRGIENYELARVTLNAILLGCRIEQESADAETTVGKSKSKTVKTVKKKEEEIKFPPSHDLFTKIIDLIEYGLKNEGNRSIDFMYPKVVQLSMQIIYRMCSEPAEVVQKILPNIHRMVFSREENMAEADGENNYKLSERVMFRYMCFGQALLGAHIMYYEQIVSKEIKARKALKEKANKKKKADVASRQRARVSTSSIISTSTMGQSMNQTNQDAAAEMDLVMGHIGFDAEQDAIKSYVAKLLDHGFFRQFRIHVFFLCSHFNEVKSLNLKVAIVRALTKLMLVCESSVTSSLEQLVKLWESQEPYPVKLEILRRSVVLTVKFPNHMEKMNESLCSGLADRNAEVRKSCMDYIIYLALSDLLKVKDQFHSVAACLNDDEFSLKEMAKDFINQIAEKDNVLQNCIPDIISRLSGRDDIPQVNFQAIMKTLLNKVKKEKQLGGLVERIVQRFKGSIPVRQCQDTIYCLTQIQVNDKTLKVMKDHIANYADKLGDPVVWDLFMNLLANYRKLQKQELKMRIDEWEKEMKEHYDKCVALDNADQAAKRKNIKQRFEMEPSSDEEENGENENGDDTVIANGQEEERNVENQEDVDGEDANQSIDEDEGMEDEDTE